MVENLNHVDGCYALAIQLEDYRAAAWQAIRALRRGTVESELWTMRLRQSLARRHQRGSAQYGLVRSGPHEAPGPESTRRALFTYLGALRARVRLA
ncbi:MAG TPA: hypothetical protein VGR13_05590 [Actinomycetota bacterium]|jgi:hypothetical protein|nr:hypothetical protein [Actinomycetota bacterium]